MLVAQLWPTPCDQMNCGPLGSSVHGILQQESWSGLPFPSAGDLPDPGTEPGSPECQADSLRSQSPGKPFPPFFVQLIYNVLVSVVSGVQRSDSVIHVYRDKNIILYNLYMKSKKKIIQMNLFTKQTLRHRKKKKTKGDKERDKLGSLELTYSYYYI